MMEDVTNTKEDTTNTKAKNKPRSRRKRGGKAKKVVAIVCIAAVAAGAGYYYYHRQHAQDNSMVMSDPVYEYAQRMDMQSTYTSNGRVISTISEASDMPQGFDSSGYMVDKVNVKVGDIVKKGDVLYTIDMTSVQDDLDQNERKLALQQAQNGIDTAAKQRSAANTKASTDQQIADNQRALDQATEDTNRAIAAQNESVDAVNEAIVKQQAAQDQYNKAQVAYEAARKQYESLKAQNDAANAKIETAKSLSDIASAKVSRLSAEGADPNDEGYRQAASEAAQRAEELTQLQAANAKLSDDTDKAKTAADDAQTALDNAKTELDNANAAIDTAVKAAQDSATQAQSAQRTLEQSQSDTISKNRDAQESVNSANDTLASAALSNESSLVDIQTAIDQDKEKLQNGTVKANMDGTVTQVNVAAGQTYAGNSAIIISNLEDLTLATDVDEAYVARISKGMRVTVTTDATGTQNLTGEVTFVANYPTDGTVSTGTDGNGGTAASAGMLLNSRQKAYYRVQVSLDDGYSQLREGMNAKITFILAEAKDAIAVPKDTITTNADGSSYLTVVDNGNIPASDLGAENSGDASSQDSAQETDLAADNTAGSTDSADSTEIADTSEGSDNGYAPTVQLPVTTGIEQGDNVQITSGNVTEDMQLVGPNTYNTYGSYSDGSDSSSLLEGLY